MRFRENHPPILRAKPGLETFHRNTSVDVCDSFLYSSRKPVFPSVASPPDQIYQQMIVAEQVSRAAPRGQKQRGETACSLFPCPLTHASAGPVLHKPNSGGNQRSPAGQDIKFTTGPKVKGQRSHKPLRSMLCINRMSWLSFTADGPHLSLFFTRSNCD